MWPLSQAMERIAIVIKAGALLVLTNLLAGSVGSKAKSVSSEIDALQLEALSCIR